MTHDIHIDIGVYGGARVERACIQACALAERLHIPVHFTFNDVQCIALPGGEPETLVENWRREIERGGRYQIATTHLRLQSDSISAHEVK